MLVSTSKICKRKADTYLGMYMHLHHVCTVGIRSIRVQYHTYIYLPGIFHSMYYSELIAFQIHIQVQMKFAVHIAYAFSSPLI